jgi:threonylcarbamoyladenosine tRNA methylthiotransferase MtaB
MQSGSDSVLRRMRRRWGSRRFIDRCQMLKERLDRPAITTDIIVGFPGETEAEFAETCETARQVGFSKIHIFPFSARRGTPAADMPGQLSKQIKHDRGQELALVEAELQAAYFASLKGRGLRVLVESPLEGDPTRVVGTSCRYATVEMPRELANCGEFVDVTAGPAMDGRIRAKALEH